MSGDLTADDLRKKFGSIWSGQPPDAEWYRKGCESALRIHRAISWVKRAEKETDDLDAKFIFYWIAFNAAYAQYVNTGDKSCFKKYFENILSLDVDNRIFSAVWIRYSEVVSSNYSELIKNFINNRFVFQNFWNHYNTAHECEPTHECDNWDVAFRREEKAVNNSIDSRNTEKILCILFERLYTLRNQLVHGGSSWNSGISRSQVMEGATIMEALVPNFIYLMMEGEGPKLEWGLFTTQE